MPKSNEIEQIVFESLRIVPLSLGDRLSKAKQGKLSRFKFTAATARRPQFRKLFMAERTTMFPRDTVTFSQWGKAEDFLS